MHADQSPDNTHSPGRTTLAAGLLLLCASSSIADDRSIGGEPTAGLEPYSQERCTTVKASVEDCR